MRVVNSSNIVARGAGSRWLRLALWAFIAIFLLSAASTVVASDAIEVGYRDFSYPNGTGGNSAPTGEKPESKLWWNDGYGRGSLWSTAGNAYHIYSVASPDTVAVDGVISKDVDWAVIGLELLPVVHSRHGNVAIESLSVQTVCKFV